MSLQVVNAFVDGPELLVIHRVGERLAEHRVRPEYSFFVKKEDLPDEFARNLRSSRAVVAMKDEGPWVRISWQDDFVRKAMLYGRKDEEGVRRPSPFQERGIVTYEGDVDPIRRWFTDTGANVAKPRIGYYDLETDSQVPIPLAKKGAARVLVWTLANEDKELVGRGVLEIESDEDERRVLREFFEQAKQFDVLAAWNGDEFDEKVLEGRVNRLGLVHIDMRKWLWLDHLKLFRRMNMNSADSGAEKQSMALQSIGMAVVGEGKEEIPAFVKEKFPEARSLGAITYELWSLGGEFRELLIRYCEKDTLLLAKIEAETGFIALFNTLCDVCRVLPNSRGLLPTQQMDGFMLRLALERQHHFATREWREEKEEHDPFAGAFVMEPKVKGLSTDVHVADFASLYPSIIMTWNMSPETKARDMAVNGPIPEGHCRSPKTGIGFRTTVDGILPIALREMIRLRKVWSEKAANLPPGTPEAKEAQRRSMAYKVAANSFYGVVGSPFSRYYDRAVGESVTQNGVWLIQHTIAAAEERGFTCIYGDTDSFFAINASKTDMETFVDWCNKELYPRLLASVGCKPEHCAIKLAYEKQFKRLVMITKKRYAGVFEHYKGTQAKPLPELGEPFDKKRHSKPEIKGLEFKRGDAIVLAQKLQEAIIMDLLRGVVSVEPYRKRLDEVLLHITKDPLPIEEVLLSKSLSKAPKDYHGLTPTGKDKTVPVHVRVAEQLIAAGKEIGEGARVAYVVIDGSDGVNAIPAGDYVGEVDRYYYWENLIYPASQRVLEAAFPDQDWKKGLEKIRPPKPRAPRKGKPALEGQLALFDRAPAASSDEAEMIRQLEWEARWRA